MLHYFRQQHYMARHHKITKPLYLWLSKQKMYAIPLRTGNNYQRSLKNKKWRIHINEKIEIDEF